MIPIQLQPLANHLWQSTLFAAIAALLTLALRRNRAQVRYWLWLAASVKFLVPFSILVTLGSYFGRHTAPVIAVTQSVLPSVIEQVGHPFAAPSPLLTALAAQSAAASWIPAILYGVWAIGFVALVSSWWLRWRSLRAALRNASPLPLPVEIKVMTSPAFAEPGIFGVRRPILLLPSGITGHLTPPELEAILAHELCHVRRRDNLATTIHMAVEAVFWFYPAVWWLGARLMDERERACDEEVLRKGSEPQVYAEGILKICELYLESPLRCVSGVTGANLKKRIEAIMTNRIVLRLTFAKKLALVTAGVSALAAPVIVGILNAPAILAQSPQSTAQSGVQSPRPLEFDAASVKLVTAPSDGRFSIGSRFDPGQFVGEYLTMQEYIQTAYTLQQGDEIVGPDWMKSRNSAIYNINARAAGPASVKDLRIMLQNLLASRFQLKFHTEDRPAPVYALVVSGKGIKLTRVKFDGPDPNKGAIHYIPSGVEFQHTSMDLFAHAISSNTLGRVIDATGIQDLFDFKLTYATKGWEPDLDPPADSNQPSIFSALQAIGLKLEHRQGTVKVYVIDHVEKVPTEN